MTSPKLRFKEFDGDWTLQNLSDSFSLISGYAFPSSASTDSGAKWLKIADVGIQEMTPNNPSYLPLEYLDKYSQFVVNKDDYVIALTRPILNKKLKIAKIGNFYDGALLNQRVAKISSRSNNLDFIYSLLQKSKTVEELENSIAGTDPPNLSLNDVKEIKLGFPSKEEQTKIASFISAVDEKIGQLKQKHELLSQYKQGMMQKLFSQQIRFKADDGGEFGEWENKTLGEVGENIIGLTYSPTDVTNDGTGILVLRSSNIKEGRLDKSDQVRVNKKIKDKIIVQPNDILICTRNGSQRLIGKSVIINDDEVMTFGAFMSIYRSEYNRFIAYLMQTPWFFEQVQMNLGARINQITTGTLNEFTFDFPCLEEQTKIANFLSAIDQKIEVVAQQIEQAKQWKKGLLQQMFV
ncbi:restriction endonuclease subunit S [Acinetobacter sp. YH16057]|uniref:restriction endonuclease subunit S n=1 Tax=Acinetobacter sp. YH16057 TaxID=2601195 RepID=UPI0015D323EE|nr:restriction endonuclease subunit S [Acinetobacter sp. YH16057]